MLGWELPPHNSGGLGVACLQMSKALADCGVVIDFVVPYAADHSNITHMKVHAATERQPNQAGLLAYDHGTPQQAADQHGLAAIRVVQRRYGQFVERLVRQQPPDVIHAHDWLTMDAGVAARRRSGSPLVVHVHGTEFDRSGEHQGNPLVHEIEQQGLLMADRIITVSQLTKEVIVNNYHIPADKVEVIYNAIDPDSLPEHTYDGSTYQYLEDLKADGYTIIGALTRLTVQKGLTYFIQAAARALSQYDKIAFVLGGSGEQRDELMALAAQLGISDRVIFTGFVRGKQWRDAYQLIDVFVMSSISEPFGLTALEAAHHDTALVLSRQTGVGEVLRHVLRFDYWDVERLADEMVALARSPGLRHALKQNVKQEYARLSWQAAAQQCLSLYSTYASASAGGNR